MAGLSGLRLSASPRRDKESANPKQMMPRIIGFAVLWLFLLVVLPLEWFGAAVVSVGDIDTWAD